MITIAYSESDPVSLNAAQRIISYHGLEEKGIGLHGSGRIELRRVEGSMLRSEAADGIGSDLIIFLSQHSSRAGVPSLTVHSLGNWGSDTKLGGKPHTLSTAAPSAMLAILTRMSGSQIKTEKTYEATHHGPQLSTPSLFAEVGGNETITKDSRMAGEMGLIVYGAAVQIASHHAEYSRVAIGIGGSHYPSKFTQLAIGKGYAFGHIMPRHAVFNEDGTDNLGMLAQAQSRSAQRPDIAVIEWKSFNSQARSRIIKALGNIGIDHERV
jgi:D-aminoacyl-tRNA deacylase